MFNSHQKKNQKILNNVERVRNCDMLCIEAHRILFSKPTSWRQKCRFTNNYNECEQ